MTQAIDQYTLSADAQNYLATLQEKLTEKQIEARGTEQTLHPLEIIDTLQQKVTDEMTVTVDVGSHYIGWRVISAVMNLAIYCLVMGCRH